MQADAMHPFHAGHRIMVAAPNDLRAIRVLLDFEIHRQKRRWPMMLRPIEFYAPGDPRSSQTDQSGFYHRLAIYEVIPVRLVLQYVDASANLRQYHCADILVL